ncbi:HAD family hydrolase [Planosporangium mesophilum]|uniref:Phosphoserine phosphatase n=1 Tax=Planosporangium mesophilum TaxID=689768 RepID=A0A8J3T6C4_9ACTN|nr:HAD-IB family hydrolase [Planosporangium mesophilum]NJC81019.1 HAD-IB family hydrolase [Planosporangium mesophilum]GII21340.1 phosphoserine phosphatase [Planosporangium mesophilum]
MASRIQIRRKSRRRAGSTKLVDPVAGWAAAEVEEALTIPADPTAAAFFDVDNTMMQGASIYYLARGLAARKYFTTGDLLRFGVQQLKFRLLASENAGDVSAARDAALAFVADWRVDDLERLSEEIFDELMAERIWAGTRALAQLHLDAGQRVWLVTAAPVELGRVIAARLGLTGAIGTVAEVNDGRYTGRLVGGLMHGPAKAQAITALAEAEGLDLTRCSAYSDSVNDIPMLSAVGHAVAVNPDSALRNEARRRGWEIRDFRTGRKAAKVAVPTAVGTAVAAGALVAGVALARRRRGAHEHRFLIGRARR